MRNLKELDKLAHEAHEWGSWLFTAAEMLLVFEERDAYRMAAEQLRRKSDKQQREIIRLMDEVTQLTVKQMNEATDAQTD